VKARRYAERESVQQKVAQGVEEPKHGMVYREARQRKFAASVLHSQQPGERTEPAALAPAQASETNHAAMARRYHVTPRAAAISSVVFNERQTFARRTFQKVE